MWKWKRKRKWISVAVMVILLFYSSPALDSAGATCGEKAIMPPGGLVWPLHGSISGPWSYECATDKGHRGIDIAAPVDTPVVASSAGVISYAGFTPAEGGGLTVSITHSGGIRSTYLHLSQLTVSKGQTVIQGQALGKSSGLFIHFGLRENSDGRDKYINPVDYLPPLVANNTPEEPEPNEATTPVALPPALAVPVALDGGANEMAEQASIPENTLPEAAAAQPGAKGLTSQEPVSSETPLPKESSEAPITKIRPNEIIAADPNATIFPRNNNSLADGLSNTGMIAHLNEVTYSSEITGAPLTSFVTGPGNTNITIAPSHNGQEDNPEMAPVRKNPENRWPFRGIATLFALALLFGSGLAVSRVGGCQNIESAVIS